MGTIQFIRITVLGQIEYALTAQDTIYQKHGIALKNVIIVSANTAINKIFI